MCNNPTAKGFKCQKCDQIFVKKDLLSDHIKGKHGEGLGKYRCQVCNKAFRISLSSSSVPSSSTSIGVSSLSSSPGIDSATGIDVFILFCNGLEIVVISVFVSLAMCIVNALLVQTTVCLYFLSQSLYFLWNNTEIMASVTIMSTRWIQFKVFNFQH